MSSLAVGLRPVAVLGVCVLFLALAPRASAMDFIWSGVVLATNVPQPKEPSPEIARLRGKLSNIFGYSHYRLVREHTEPIDSPVEHWLLPGKRFSLRVSSVVKSDLGYVLHLQIFQQDRMLAETDAKLGVQSPAFIRGPLCGRGQLIFILLVR